VFTHGAAEYDARVAALIADDEDLVEYVSRLESLVDDEDDEDEDTGEDRGRPEPIAEHRGRPPTSSVAEGRALPPAPRRRIAHRRACRFRLKHSEGGSRCARSARRTSSKTVYERGAVDGGYASPSTTGAPAVRSGSASRPNQPTSEHSRGGWHCSSPPDGRGDGTAACTSRTGENPIRWPVDDGDHAH
jgi:hypothetical protein